MNIPADKTFAALVIQTGLEVRASISTKSIETDDLGHDRTVRGHANTSVSISKGEVSTNELFKSLCKIPAARHLRNHHEVLTANNFDKAGVNGIAILFTVRFAPPTPSAEVPAVTTAAEKTSKAK